jgi:hypothetical protein
MSGFRTSAIYEDETRITKPLGHGTPWADTAGFEEKIKTHRIRES